MTAPSQTRTTVGRLVYRVLPPLDMGRLGADLAAALGGREAGGMRAEGERHDLRLMDVGGSRVGVGLARDLDGRGAAAVIVTVGHGPEGEGEPSLARRRAVLARLIVQRIAARFPPVETLWSETDEVATEEGFERLRAELVEQRRLEDAERARPRREAQQEALEVQRMFARLERALEARRAGRPEPADGPGATRPAKATEEVAGAPLRLAGRLVGVMARGVARPVGLAVTIRRLTRGGGVSTGA